VSKDETLFSRKPYLFILRADIEKSQTVFGGKVRSGLVSQFRLRPCERDANYLLTDAVVRSGRLIFWKLFRLRLR
jgi:hypothetical protein